MTRDVHGPFTLTIDHRTTDYGAIIKVDRYCVAGYPCTSDSLIAFGWGFDCRIFYFFGFDRGIGLITLIAILIGLYSVDIIATIECRVAWYIDGPCAVATNNCTTDFRAIIEVDGYSIAGRSFTSDALITGGWSINIWFCYFHLW